MARLNVFSAEEGELINSNTDKFIINSLFNYSHRPSFVRRSSVSGVINRFNKTRALQWTPTLSIYDQQPSSPLGVIIAYYSL